MQIEIREKIENIFLKQKDNFSLNWKNEIKSIDVNSQKRIEAELYSYGPLNELLSENDVTEILVNQYNQIFYEKAGEIFQYTDHFFSQQTYNLALDRLAQNCGTYLNREKPFVEAQFENFRVTIIFSEIARGSPLLSIRKQPQICWTLAELKKHGFFTDEQLQITDKVLKNKKNFIVIGGTASGKTSFLQALLNELNKNERAVIIEDTQELQLPNEVSVSLLTRQDPSQSVQDVTMDDLLKRSLRLRPDRLVVGEIRGPEAKSLLLALSTGHDGSFGSMHARSAQEAMLRLEMLIQMGAPQWSLYSIRNLIKMTLDYILVIEKKEGKRRLKEIIQISSLEETGLTFQRVD